MIRLALILAAAFALFAPAAQAQYNSSAIERLCVGGRNQMGNHICACDQTLISGRAALILGNATPLTNDMPLSDCQAWAARMNAGTPPPPTARPEVQCYGGRNQMNFHVCACDTPTMDGRTALITGKSTPLTGPSTNDECQAWANRMNGVTPPPGGVKPPKVGLPKIGLPKTPAKVVIPDLPGVCGSAYTQCRAGVGSACQAAYNICEEKRRDDIRNAAVDQGLLSPDEARSWADASRSTPDTGDTDDSGGSASETGKAGLISSNWNTGGCNLTTQARFTLDKPSTVNHLDTWINWTKTGGNSMSATLRGPVQMSLNYQRDECHPNMPDWCRGVAQVNQVLPAGDYMVVSSAQAMCVNSGSANNGYVQVYGSAADQAPSPSAEQRIRSMPFNFRFDCPTNIMNGQVACGQNYWAKYDMATNTWEVCGRLATKSENMCQSYSNAPAQGATFSVWGEVMTVTGDGTLMYRSSRVGQVDLTNKVVAPRRVKPDLPTLKYNFPDLGMPGNRQGTGGGSIGRWGYN